MTALDAIETTYRKARLRASDYFLLDEAGAFADHAKTELLDGDVYYMNAQHRRHGLLKTDLHDALRDSLRAMGTSLRSLVETTILLDAHNAPEPDIVVTGDPYGDGPIPVESVALIVEVSDTTLAFDLGRKAALYAAAGVPEYWVADIAGQRLVQHWSPTDGTYVEQREAPLAGPISSATLPGLHLPQVGG